MGIVTWPRIIAQNTKMQAASPAIEINRLFTLFGIGLDALKYLAYGIMLISGISIFIALFNTLKERKYEFALLRRTDPEALADMMGQPGAVILKCTTTEDTLLGCVFLRKTEKQLYLGMLTVSPELQGGGIGKALLNASEAHARQQGCDRIVMSVISVRKELIDWYKRNGYRLTGETSPFPNDPRFGIPRQELEFVIMEKKVAESH